MCLCPGGCCVTYSAPHHMPFRGSLYRQLGNFNHAQEDFHLAINKCGLSPDHPTFKLAIRQLALTYNDVAVSLFRSVTLSGSACRGCKVPSHLLLCTPQILFRTPPYPYPPCRKGRFRDAAQLLSHSIDVEKSEKVLYTNRGGGLATRLPLQTVPTGTCAPPNALPCSLLLSAEGPPLCHCRL